MDNTEILRMVFQLDAHTRYLTPLLPGIGRKLVSDLLATGVSDRSIAGAIKRSPSYVRAVAGGGKVLTPANIVAIVQFAAKEASRHVGK